MSREREIFEAVLEAGDAAARSAAIDRTCGGDAALRVRMEALLAANEGAEAFFSDCAEAIASSVQEMCEPEAASVDPGYPGADVVGAVLGPYRLLEKMGDGGWGTVYLAQQEKPVQRHVALKIIKLGMDTRSVIERFEAERQALAMMSHPGIARVFDAGATETGRPFFVMELVEGVRITDYCDVHRLSIRQRLELFIGVCQAIQHAHQKGIIHRDIKPSNILVASLDGQPQPKVIDFGIAKAIEEEVGGTEHRTLQGQLLGTPAYMSPEQARMNAAAVDTRSDIYSLGVLLYELLVGAPPFDQKELLDAGVDEMRRTLCEREPARPSSALKALSAPEISSVAASRGSDPAKLLSEVRGDLDWIAMKALEKDPERRYPTAYGLAADLKRHLANEPVGARPPSRLYRLRKLISRNKVTFGAGAAVAAALILGLGVSTYMYAGERAARVRADIAEQQERRLREESEDRERIAQAAYLLSRGKFEEADSCVSKVSTFSPSLEAESVLRSLGEWHLLRGETALAARRFTQLLRIDQGNRSDMISVDLLLAGPLLIESGDQRGYEQFRQAAIDRFVGTKDPVNAERALKVSLLLPPQAIAVKSLEPFARVIEASLHGDPVDASITDRVSAAWRYLSLGLLAYRKGEFADAKEFCAQSLAFPLETGARIATAHAVAAMACQKLGETHEAAAHLAKAQSLVSPRLKSPIKRGDGWAGYWYDWLFARVLLREAELQSSDPKQ